MSTQDSSDNDPAITGDLFEVVPDGTDEPRQGTPQHGMKEAPSPADLAHKRKEKRFGHN